MAGQTVNSVTSAVTGELTSRVFSGLIQRYGKDAATREKLQRLEMLLIKIHSAVEASEKRTIDNSWLLQWREKLKEAASRGDEVLASFRQRVKDAQDTSSAHGNQKQGEAVSSSSSAAAAATPVGTLSFARNSLSGRVQGICSARKMLFSSGDDDMERLNKTLESLEVLSPDMGEFIRLLQLEALPKVEQTPCGTELSPKVHGPTAKIMKTRRKKKRRKDLTTHTNPSSGPLRLSSFSPPKEEKMELLPPVPRRPFRFYSDYSFDSECDSAVSPKQQQFMVQQDRLEAALAEIFEAVELADSHDLEDLEWLAYWAGILREAKAQGRDVLGTTSACKTVNTETNEEPAVERDQEEDELVTLVHRLEGLARDVEYFSKLVYLCPAR